MTDYTGACCILNQDRREFLIDAEDLQLTPPKKWRATGRLGRNQYVRAGTVVLHRLLMNPIPSAQVDHVNGNGLDNRRANLRLCSVAENRRNRRFVKSASGLKGAVLQRNGKYGAGITVNGKRIHLGVYATAIEAHAAYCNAARELHGEFARFA